MPELAENGVISDPSTPLPPEDEAIALLNQTIDVYRSAGNSAAVVRLMALLGMAYARRGSAREGLERLEPLVASRRAAGTTEDLPALFITLATLGEPQQARQRLTEAVAMFARMGERLYARQAERALADVERVRPQ